MKGIDSNSPVVPWAIPDELVQAEINLRMKHMDIDDLRYFQDDFEAGVEWAEQQMGNLAVEFADWLLWEPQYEQYSRMKKSTLELYKEFIKFKENGDKD